MMKLVAMVHNESGQAPSSLGGLFARYLAGLLARAKTRTADPDGLLFAILQLTKETFPARQGARRGFSEARGIEVLGQAAVSLKDRDVSASPLEILKLLTGVGIYQHNRRPKRAAHPETSGE